MSRKDKPEGVASPVPTEERWIPIEGTEPPTGPVLLVVIDKHVQHMPAIWDGNEWTWLDSRDEDEPIPIEKITHWRLLPDPPGMASPVPTEEDLKQQLALKLDLALMELSGIDSVLARRPALSGSVTRIGKIETALAAAGRYDALLRRFGAHGANCNFVNGSISGICNCGWAEVEKELRSGVASPVVQTTPNYSTNLAPIYIAEQIFFHVLQKGGDGNPFRSINSKWFSELASPKIRELLQGDTPVVQEAPQLQKLRDLILEHDAEEDGEGNFVIRFNCAEWMEIARLLDKSASGGVPVGWEQNPQTSASSGAESTKPPLRNEPLAVVQEAPQPLESRPSEDAFESAWREYNANGNAGGWERIAFISGFEKGFKAAQAPLREAAQRSDKDYAIEHAEYLAKAAEHLMDEINKYDMAESAGDECDADARSGAWQSLRAAIGEFRKRAKRASKSSSVLREAATPPLSNWVEVRRGFGEIELSTLASGEYVMASGKRDGGWIIYREALADSSAPKDK